MRDGEARRPDAVTLVLARHAESQLNAERRFSGRTDAALSALGLAQAQGLREELGTDFEGVYASRLKRAVQTARPIAEPTQVGGLHEMDQGELEGLTYAEGLARYPDFFAAWAVDPSSMPIPGGESLALAAQRVERALLEVAGGHPAGSRVLVVGHQMAFAALLVRLRGAAPNTWKRHALRNAAWTQVHVVGATLSCAPLG